MLEVAIKLISIDSIQVVRCCIFRDNNCELAKIEENDAHTNQQDVTVVAVLHIEILLSFNSCERLAHLSINKVTDETESLTVWCGTSLPLLAEFADHF